MGLMSEGEVLFHRGSARKLASPLPIRLPLLTELRYAAPSPRALCGSRLMGTSRKTWRCAKHIVRSSSEDWDALCAAIATVKGMS